MIFARKIEVFNWCHIWDHRWKAVNASDMNVAESQKLCLPMCRSFVLQRVVKIIFSYIDYITAESEYQIFVITFS